MCDGLIPLKLSFTQRIAPAVGLFFVSPLVGEFLLGNVAIDFIFAWPVLAPMYGGGAVLIREATRRTGKGWPTILGLGVAYSLLEEAVITQLLFNPTYHGLTLTGAVIPGLEVSATQAVNIATLHTVWSMAVPIALMEAFVPARRKAPWLGRRGLAVVAVAFLFGCGFIGYSEYEESGFIATGMQLAAATLAVAVLAVGSFGLPRDLRRAPTGRAPHPWVVMWAAFVATSLFMALLFELLSGWLGVGAWAILVATSVAAVVHWATRPDWGDWHRLALATGALLTYAWSAFPQQPVLGSAGAVDLAGNAIFGVVALGLPLAAARRLLRRERENPIALH